MGMTADRTINFGKYKGTPIKQLILKHIGYIYWCLSNLKWFKLNDEEQALYDALAIANIKYNMNLPFPVQELAEHIKNKDKYVERDSPFIISRDGMISYHIQDEDNPIIRSILKYKEDDIRPTRFTTSNMADATKYLFEPIEDEPYDDYFLGENPHSWVE